MPSGTSRYYALEGQVHTTRSTRGFDFVGKVLSAGLLFFCNGCVGMAVFGATGGVGAMRGWWCGNPSVLTAEKFAI